MITTDPVGDWTWEAASDGRGVQPSRAFEVAAAVWNVLARVGIATPVAEVGVTVRSVGDMRDVLFEETGLPLESEPFDPRTALSRAASQVDSLQGDFVVAVRMRCPGMWTVPGARHRAEQLFTIQADVWKRSLTAVTLETYSDVWLTMDTRDREQIATYDENAPRLALALKEISELLGCAPTPGDENRYATPTETGFADIRIEGPAYVDAWGTFEVPARSRRLRSSLPPSEDEYAETTELPVHYFTVQDEAQVLGYVWAAPAENAAGFEPRTAAGERAFEAGRAWLLQLREAHRLGLPAMDALNWLAQQPTSSGTGRLLEKTPRSCPSLDSLEEISGRW
ncbi:hypothetical protein ACIBO9_10390 [Streptomyces prunicolor]|uniref:hypothetical protein n=1 Tax=Streptomyces prunicolor TaxID=67348 RepID=UPI0037D5DF19